MDRRIDRLRELAAAEPRLDGVLLYGSWTLGEADAHSDIEAYLYVRDEGPCAGSPDDGSPGDGVLGDGSPRAGSPRAGDGTGGTADDAGPAAFDGPAFLGRLAPLKLAYTNMYGVLSVVFDDLMRGEFHIEPAGRGIAGIAGWRGLIHFPEPERAVLLDRTGSLTRAARALADCPPPDPAPTARQLVDELTNWTLMFAHVRARGETARAHALLHTVVAPEQLRLLRLLRGSTAHWLTPSRRRRPGSPTGCSPSTRAASSPTRTPPCSPAPDCAPGSPSAPRTPPGSPN
ncbi:nucleotidyltransferase domain-containing protein [Streptomyces clavuligerus]|uniref:nucleotidyltransferase domain-containing protein n=1 Tax=Streptomyces clavuligerus TaxID=1901 RepID=UPI001E4159A3